MKEHPIFARFYDWLARKAAPVEDPFRREILEGVRGRVLEVGAGSGLNFAFYAEDARVVAAEPEPNMIRQARTRAAKAPVPVTMVRAAAEALPFRNGAFDAVVLSLVMCSVRRPGTAAAEVRRVLQSDGELRVFEHVRSASPSAARWQTTLTPLWGPFSGGCHLDRDTAATIEAAGFDVSGVRREKIGPPNPARPCIVGVARPR
ncbi:MAG TPA: class I SAM-dependent methyltransferase [Actinomycetota bacterium]|nr:class I SAM-dependent methyltransferase [Actinomycetota bacterium]